MTASDELIHQFIEYPASLSEADLDRLIEVLRKEPKRAIELREQLIVSDLLGQKLALDRRNFFAQIEQRLADFERGEEEVYNQVADLRAIAEANIDQVRPPKRSSWWIPLLAGALVLLVAVGLVVWQYQGETRRPVANVEEISGDVARLVGGNEVKLEVGKTLSTGDSLVVAPGSTLVWKYKDGTTIRILGDSVTRITADPRSLAKEVRLDKGELVASVAKQTRGPMVFTTPHATATVRGTELRLVVSQANTQLDVAEGLVELQRHAGGKVLQVAAHESGIATAENLQTRSVTWPLNKSVNIFRFEGMDRTPLSRNPESLNLRNADFEQRGEVSESPKHALVLAGGTYHSDDAGADLLPALQKAGRFGIEIAFKMTEEFASNEAYICSLGPVGRENLVLFQTGREIRLRLKAPSTQAMPSEVSLGEFASGKRYYLTICKENGQILVFVDGKKVSAETEIVTSMAQWEEGPLVLGGDAAGGHAWHGEIAGIAIYDEVLDAAMTSANRERFNLLHP